MMTHLLTPTNIERSSRPREGMPEDLPVHDKEIHLPPILRHPFHSIRKPTNFAGGTHIKGKHVFIVKSGDKLLIYMTDGLSGAGFMIAARGSLSLGSKNALKS